MKYIISNQEELAQLKNPVLKMGLRSITLRSDNTLDSQLEKRLNRYYFACGCQSGSVFVLLTMLACAVTGLLYGFDGTLTWWRILIYMAVAAITGKGFGLLWSRMQLRRLYRQLETLLPAATQHGMV